MKALVIFCHPKPDSFNAAIRDVVVSKLEAKGAEIRIDDLYARGFDPVLTAGELDNYLDADTNTRPVEKEVSDIRWCDTLIFVYPTWWYGLPAMLKGWLDRALVPDVAFLMPDEMHKDIRSGLTHIQRLGVFTTCGASRWLTAFIGAPGKRTLLRGVGLLCAKHLKKAFVAHYLMDSSTDASRKAHLDRVAATMDRLIN